MDIAEYICEDKERLQMALRVHEAMPTVRENLIKRIFEAVGKQVAEELDGVEVRPKWYGVDIHTQGAFYVYAEVSDNKVQNKNGDYWLNAGLRAHEDTVDKAKADEMRERFKAKSDLGHWSSGKNFDGGTYVAYAYIQHEGKDDRWDNPSFLSRAIRNHDEVVSDVAEILVRIYEGVFGR